MNLRQLEYFIAIAEEGSFRAAAERVRVAPPSLSQQIRVLEAEVGGPLLERLSRGSRLTPAAARSCPRPASAVLAARRGGRAARAALDLEQAELEVATVLSLAVGLLPTAIERLYLAYPGIAVRLHEYIHRDELARAVADGVGDIAVGPAPPDREGPVVELGHEQFVVIAGPRHPALESSEPVPIGDPGGRRLDPLPSWHGLHGLVTAICAMPVRTTRRDQHGAGRGRRPPRFGGLGVAIVPANIVPPHLAATCGSSTHPSSGCSTPTPGPSGRPGAGAPRRARAGALAGSCRPAASCSDSRRSASAGARVACGSASASSVATSATRSSEPFCLTPSSSMIVQNGQATASVEAPVSAASRARSSLIWLPRSSIHMCPPPAPQQNVRLPLRAISSGLPTRETISRGAAITSLWRAR